MAPDEDSDRRHAKGVSFAILSSVCSSISLISYKIAIEELGPLASVFFSELIGGVILIIIAWKRDELRKLPELLNHWKELLLIMLFRPGIGGLFLAYSLTFTTSMNVMFLSKAEPYLVMLWFWLFEKGKVTGGEIRLLTIHIFGAFLLSTGGVFAFQGPQIGDLLLFTGLIFYSLTYAAGKRAAHALGATTTSAVTQFGGALFLAPLFLILPSNHNLASTTGWMYLLIALALFNIFGILLWYGALARLKGWLVSALRATGPLAAAPLAWSFLGETLAPMQIAGAALVLLTSAGLVYEHRK